MTQAPRDRPMQLDLFGAPRPALSAAERRGARGAMARAERAMWRKVEALRVMSEAVRIERRKSGRWAQASQVQGDVCGRVVFERYEAEKAALLAQCPELSPAQYERKVRGIVRRRRV